MFTRDTGLFLLGALLFPGQPGIPAERNRVDGVGDPLPPGVAARLGTERLFEPGYCYLEFSPDGKTLASFGDSRVCLWQVSSGKELHAIPLPQARGHSPSAGPLAFAPDGNTLAVSCWDRTLRLYDVTSGRETSRVSLASTYGSHVVFGPQGRTLVVGGDGASIHLFDIEQGKLTRDWGEFKAETAPPFAQTAPAFSADGKTLVAFTQLFNKEGQVGFSLWDPATREMRGQRQVLGMDTNFACRLAPNGRFVAAPTRDGKAVRLLDSTTGRELRRTQGEASYPAKIAFAGDSNTLTTISKDGVLRIWETASGKLLHQHKMAPRSFKRWPCPATAGWLRLPPERIRPFMFWRYPAARNCSNSPAIAMGHSRSGSRPTAKRRSR